MQHRTPWLDSRGAVEAVLTDAEADNLAAKRLGIGVSCWVERAEEGGLGAAERAAGSALEVYAERVLNRADAAPTTLRDDRVLYGEDATIPGVSKAPLGVGARWGQTPVTAITRRDIQRWLLETQARPSQRGGLLSASQVRQRFWLLRRILREAIEDGVLPVDPTISVTPPAP